MNAVIYKRIPHAAHYAFDHPRGGHDLEQWIYAQPVRLPVPDKVPINAQYHVGFVVDGVQHWIYQRVAPLSHGCCPQCCTAVRS